MLRLEDPWVVSKIDINKYKEYFSALKPEYGYITGQKAKNFFIKSGLQSSILATIWSLADADVDGKLDLKEFSVACKLISMKLKGVDTPTALPSSLIQSLSGISLSPASEFTLNLDQELSNTETNFHISKPYVPESLSGTQSFIAKSSSQVPTVSESFFATTSTQPRQPLTNVTSLFSNYPHKIIGDTTNVSHSLLSTPLMSPSISHPVVPATLGSMSFPSVSTNFLPSVMQFSSPSHMGNTLNANFECSTNIDPFVPISLQSSKINHNKDWAVPKSSQLKYAELFNNLDSSKVGFLNGMQARHILLQTGLAENILAHIWNLADVDVNGNLTNEEFVLALHLCDMVRSGIQLGMYLPTNLIPPSFLSGKLSRSSSEHTNSENEELRSSTMSFEVKRKENFEKGQAELERRRKALLEQQQRENEERIRKQKEEQEKQERLRQEEEKLMKEKMEMQIVMEKELQLQRELEQKKNQEQKEAARKEMERQCHLEWERQKRQEILMQHQKQKEILLQLKAKKQKTAIDLSLMNDKLNDTQKQIDEYFVKISHNKSVIDDMRESRDVKVAEENRYKTLLQEQAQRIIDLDAKRKQLEDYNKMDLSTLADSQIITNLVNRKLLLNQIKEKLDSFDEKNQLKIQDLKNYNEQLIELKQKFKILLSEMHDIYSIFKKKHLKVMEIKEKNKIITSPLCTAQNGNNILKYKVLYQFEARSHDELSIYPGDIIEVNLSVPTEPGWLAGKINDKFGWFPEAYAEKLQRNGNFDELNQDATADVSSASQFINYMKDSPLITTYSDLNYDIAKEHPWTELNEKQIESLETKKQNSENWSDSQLVADDMKIPEYYVAMFPFQSDEPGDLSFMSGDQISVIKKEGNWWLGSIGERTGMFPYNYVQPVEMPNLSHLPENEIKEKSENGKSIQTKNYKPEIASVIIPYTSSGPEQLSLQRGQLILIKKKSESGWWQGELQAKGKQRQTGWFPASYVCLLNKENISTNYSEKSLNFNKKENSDPNDVCKQEVLESDYVKALHEYSAQNEDELTFHKDDVIQILDKNHQSWWKGLLHGKIGVFPSNYVTPIQLVELPLLVKAERTRQHHIYELISTEERYVNDLILVEQYFQKPMVQHSLISVQEMNNIFVNWSDLIKCNSNLLKDLRIRRKLSSFGIIHNVGDILCENIPQFTPYIKFCSVQVKAVSFLQKITSQRHDLEHFEEQFMRDSRFAGLSLSSYLLKPMQRITRYPLLIQRILDVTPVHYSDCLNLQEAFRRAEELCQQVNEGVREGESSDRLEWMQNHIICSELDEQLNFNSLTNALGPRKFLYCGVLHKVKSGKELVGFLLNDFILLAKPNRPLSTSCRFILERCDITFRIYKRPFFLNEFILDEKEAVKEIQDTQFLLCFQNYELLLKAPTINEKNNWVFRIRKGIRNLCETGQEIYNVCSRLDSCKNSKGILRLLVLEGRELQKVTGHCNSFCEVSLGSQVCRTQVTENSTNPIWDSSMQFMLNDLQHDILCFTVYNRKRFSPNVAQARAVHTPLTHYLTLEEVNSGELLLRIDVQLFFSNNSAS